MRLISEGRASQIFDLGDGRVLRRFKRGGHAECEARLMRLAAAGGFPVPSVLGVRSDGLVLEKIEGPTMRDALSDATDGELEDAARELAHLHAQLHKIASPEGGVLLHCDLHWKNVIASAEGSVVIDWANARGGDPTLDTALTWLILTTSSGEQGRRLATFFAAVTDVETGRAAAMRTRLSDPSLSEQERAAVAHL